MSLVLWTLAGPVRAARRCVMKTDCAPPGRRRRANPILHLARGRRGSFRRHLVMRRGAMMRGNEMFHGGMALGGCVAFRSRMVLGGRVVLRRHMRRGGMARALQANAGRVEEHSSEITK